MAELNSLQALRFFTTGLDIGRSKKLVKDLVINPPIDLTEAFHRAEEFIAIEEALENFKPHDQPYEKSKDRDKPSTQRSDNSQWKSDNPGKKSYNGGGSGSNRPPLPNRSVSKVYTPLTADRSKI